MKRPRLIFFVLICVSILVGLLSRHYSFIPLFIGDILWATMVYFIVRFLFIKASFKQVIIGALLFCYAIEFSQLYHAPRIESLRHTLFGRLVLGDVFLWSDLLCYTVGVGIAILIDVGLQRKAKST